MNKEQTCPNWSLVCFAMQNNWTVKFGDRPEAERDNLVHLQMEKCKNTISLEAEYTEGGGWMISKGGQIWTI